MADTDRAILHEVYEMWDLVIEKVKKEIYRFEGKQEQESEYILWCGIQYTHWSVEQKLYTTSLPCSLLESLVKFLSILIFLFFLLK